MEPAQLFRVDYGPHSYAYVSAHSADDALRRFSEALNQDGLEVSPIPNETPLNIPDDSHSPDDIRTAAQWAATGLGVISSTEDD